MTINLELLIADLSHKLRNGFINPYDLNLEADIRGIILNHELPATKSAALTSPATGNTGALEA